MYVDVLCIAQLLLNVCYYLSFEVVRLSAYHSSINVVSIKFTFTASIPKFHPLIISLRQ